MEQGQMGGQEPEHIPAGKILVSHPKLVSLLYTLLRDEVPPGVMEERMLNIEQADLDDGIDLTNGYVAGYAKNIAGRLT